MNQSNKQFNKLIDRIRKDTQFEDVFKDGYTPEDIKQSVIEFLLPYFSNRDVLEHNAVDYLMSDAIALVKLSKNKLAFELFEYALSIHHLAYSQDLNNCVRTSIEWQPAIFDGLSLFWTQFHLEIDKQNLPDDEFLHECLRNMGVITEGAFKNLAKELLQQQRILNGSYTLSSSTRELDFGNVIDELNRSSPNPFFFAPNGVRLNQWRNICQHYSANVVGTEFIFKYGKPEKEFRLTRNGLIQVTKHILDLFSGLNLANSIFTFDHLSELKNAGLIPENIQIRSEMEFMNIASGLLSQGFEVVDFQKDEKKSILVIRDITNLEPDKRRLHTIQFIDLLWNFTKSQKVSVEYIEHDGTPNFRTSATAEMFARIEKENLHPSSIVEEAEMIDLKNNLKIPKNRKRRE